MNNIWSATSTFETSYKQQHGSSIHPNTDASRLNDPKRFKTRNDTLLKTNKENNHNDFLTVTKISYKDPMDKKKPFSLLDTMQSGFTKNNLNNDGLTYYNGRTIDKKDLTLTEYKNKFRAFK